MNIPDGAVDCWYITETEKLEAKNIQNYCNYQTDDYFKLIKRINSCFLEGYLGRKDTSSDFFNAIDQTYTYFLDYRNQKNIYFTFDKTRIFQVVNIFPEKPLLISLKQVNVTSKTQQMINQEDIYQLVFKERWQEILSLLYLHKKDIAGDTLLKSAATTFEDAFFKKVNTVPIEDKVLHDNLDTIYALNYGKFYLLQPGNLKILIVEMVRRNPLNLGYNYALQFPEEDICKEVIRKYEMQFGKQNSGAPKRQTHTSPNWIEIYNRIFELINQKDDAATYFTGPRFIKVIKEYQPYFPDYNQYIEQRNQEGKSTSRKIFYYDILLGLDKEIQVKVIESILKIVKPFQPEKVAAIEMLLGKKSFDIEIVQSTGTAKIPSENPIVFMSYSWDDESHKEWVLNLANRLTSDGINVILDRFYLKPGKNLPHFVEQSIAKAERIIIVFTPNYKLKADRRTGGVGYEYSIMNADLYKNQATNEKIIPIIRTGTMEDSIPTFMQQFIHIDLSNDEKFENSYTDLLREIFNEPAIKKPSIGSKPIFG